MDNTRRPDTLYPTDSYLLRPANTVTGATRPRRSSNPGVAPGADGNLPRAAPGLQRPASIRIRRLPSSSDVPTTRLTGSESATSSEYGGATGRRRSTSAPIRPNSELLAEQAQPSHMATVQEGVPLEDPQPGSSTTRPRRSGSLGSQRLRTAGAAARNRLGFFVAEKPMPLTPDERAQLEYEREIVDILDVVGKSLPNPHQHIQSAHLWPCA